MSSLKIEKDWKFKTIRSFDETPIRYATYSRGTDPSKALIFLNGRTEWIEKYQGLPLKLNLPEDVVFITMDHRGQGASGGLRADVDSYESFVKDIGTVLNRACRDLPYSIIAHSMGGLIGLYGCLTHHLTAQKG